MEPARWRRYVAPAAFLAAVTIAVVLIRAGLESGSAASTTFAAWNAVIYVNQIEDERLDPVVNTGAYLPATQEALHKYGGLWFNDEAFVVVRRESSEQAAT